MYWFQNKVPYFRHLYMLGDDVIQNLTEEFATMYHFKTKHKAPKVNKTPNRRPFTIQAFDPVQKHHQKHGLAQQQRHRSRVKKKSNSTHLLLAKMFHKPFVVLS